MELSRARGSEEVVEVKEEKTTTIVTHNARPSRALWTDWDSPNLAEELVDRIWDMVRDWLRDREPAASDFFHYCLNFCDNRGEADEVRVWMLNLIAHFVTEDEKWLDSVHTAKDWRQLGLSCNHWEVPPPLTPIQKRKKRYKVLGQNLIKPRQHSCSIVKVLNSASEMKILQDVTDLWTMNITFYKEKLNPLSSLMTGATYWCKKQTAIVLVSDRQRNAACPKLS